MISWFFERGDKVISTFDKSKEDHFKALDLKNDFLVMTKSLILWVDFSLGFALVISQFDYERKFPKKNVRLIFVLLFYLKIFFIIILLFCLFLVFKRGYGVKDRSDFILTEIKRC